MRTLPSKALPGQSNPQWIDANETGAAQSVAALLGHAKAMEQWTLESRTGWPPSPGLLKKNIEEQGENMY